MARIKYEGRTKIHFVPTIADTSGPTAAELAAGDDLTSFITKDGYQPNVTNNKIDTGGIDTDFITEIQGSYGAALTLQCMRDDTTDTAWTTLQRGTQGYIVLGYDSAAGIAVSDDVQVWPVEFGTPVMQPSAANTMQMFIADAAIAEPPTLDAVVA